ncbi:hypothetical protein [Streptomyces sp. H51]|uniref:hypothetical protein n=1 Tax=Streptomyces sp. H51 TaxID=3111770 RepID=UPI002D794345|nr:hypothetical protein [Streptomyces sp. H51]
MSDTDTSSRWLVVFTEQPFSLQITDVAPLPENPDAQEDLRTELWANCLSSYTVDAAGPAEARRTARQLHDVDRIRNARARQHACRARRRAFPTAAAHGPDAIEMAAQDVDLTHQCRAYAGRMAAAALQAGYRHRTWPQRDLTFEQYLALLPAAVQTVLHRYAVLAATDRNDEAVALLVNTLAASVSDL